MTPEEKTELLDELLDIIQRAQEHRWGPDVVDEPKVPRELVDRCANVLGSSHVHADAARVRTADLLEWIRRLAADLGEPLPAT